MTDSTPRLPAWVRNALGAVALCIAFVTGAVVFGGGGETPGASDAVDAEWTCAMHPQIRQGEPGDCPICGMDLVTVGSDATSNNTVVLSDRARVLSGIRTTSVERYVGATAQVQLLGRIEPAETTRRNVTTLGHSNHVRRALCRRDRPGPAAGAHRARRDHASQRDHVDWRTH